jgi:hypothetical protein
MSYHRTYCFPDQAILRLQPRAAGPIVKDLIPLVGPYESIPYTAARGLLVIDPRYDNLPLGPGWEWRGV